LASAAATSARLMIDVPTTDAVSTSAATSSEPASAT
jgi:hypothetical protein